MLNIDSKASDYGLPVLRLGFRPFFLVASLFSVIAMCIWMAQFIFSVEFKFSGLPANYWHAHEMIFGYTMAVIAGFLLTAIKNWTGEEVLRGGWLACLFVIWFIARLLPLIDFSFPVGVIAVVDVSFLLLLTIVCLMPILKVKQYKQLGIISKLFLLMLCNVMFYLGVAEVFENGVQWGLYSALYMIIALVLVMMRRVMPMFIQNGIDGEFKIKNRAWIDYSSLVLLVCLWISDVFTSFDYFVAAVAAILTILHSIRFATWYTHRVWKKPLLWILVVAYGFIIFGFSLIVAKIYFDVSPFLFIHAFGVGGIGLVSIGMMSRVSLGHTGRNVFEPPKLLFWSLLALTLSAFVRVVLPLFDSQYYVYWIITSQLLWITAFVIFIYVYAPMFLTKRIDGGDG